MLQFLIYGSGLFGIVFASQNLELYLPPSYKLEGKLESSNVGGDSYFSFMTEKFRLMQAESQPLSFYKGMYE